MTGRWAEEWKGTGVGVGGAGGRVRFAKMSTTGVTSSVWPRRAASVDRNA